MNCPDCGALGRADREHYHVCEINERKAMQDVQQEPLPIVLCFLDLETTGLDPMKHDIIEAAAIRIKIQPGPEWEKSWTVERTFETKVMPGHSYVEPFVAGINGFSAEAWKDASPLPDVLVQLYNCVHMSILCGSKPDFDFDFMKVGFEALGWNFPRLISNHRIDVPTFALRLLLEGKIKRIKQHDVAKHFGLADQKHTAMADVLQCIEVFKRLQLPSFIGAGAA
jgi:DNA polymerase III subunit epsilon